MSLLTRQAQSWLVKNGYAEADARLLDGATMSIVNGLADPWPGSLGQAPTEDQLKAVDANLYHMLVTRNTVASQTWGKWGDQRPANVPSEEMFMMRAAMLSLMATMQMLIADMTAIKTLLNTEHNAGLQIRSIEDVMDAYLVVMRSMRVPQ